MDVRKFFEGIEDNSAFCFTIDNNGNFVPVKEPSYSIYTGEIYPFVIFEEELYSINQYCYEISQVLFKNYDTSKEKLENYKDLNENYSLDGMCTKYELVMEAENKLYMWGDISESAVYHLIVLIYSFIERALHKIFLIFQENGNRQGMLTENNKTSKAKIYRYLEFIFGTSASDIFKDFPKSFEILENARKIRNSTLHGSFLNNEINDDYEEVRISPSFSLTELINTVSYILWITEKRYKACFLN